MRQRTSSLDHRSPVRRGVVLPILVLVIVALVAFLALAIDLGMLAIAKTQAQQSADLAALTAMRSLNGNAAISYNQSAATTNAQNVVTYNKILGKSLQSSQLQLSFGSYDYNSTTATFQANFPATSGSPETAVSATVTSNSLPVAFSTILNYQFLPNVSATAQAVHRPRDIALVMDLSGSMRMGTCLGYDFYTTSRTSNNPDSLIPTFGQYSSSNAQLQGPTSNQTSTYESYTISPSNTTAANTSYNLTYVNSFYQNAAYASTLIRAFDSYTSADGGATWSANGSGSPQLPATSCASAPGGDSPLFKFGSTTTYATTVKDVVNSGGTKILWELDGYSAYSAGKLDATGTGGVPTVWTQVDYSNPLCQFNGYTQGPGYYGKTFFLWPPDPRNTTTPSGTLLTTFLGDLGVSGSDSSTLATNWSTWGPGTSAGLTSLQNWLLAHGYTATSPLVSGTTAPTYFAVCRLFNRAYPAGSSNGQFPADWRSRFFNTTNPMSNSLLFASTGSLNVPGGLTYTINYNNILAWIAQSPNPFPTQLRSGCVQYYGTIPTAITGTWPSYGGTDQRFWVEVIDYMLGFRQTAAGVYSDISAMAGYGGDFSWGTKAITGSSASGLPYMSYTDNPLRPKLRYWFGPMAMVDYMQNFNIDENVTNFFVMQPGNSYEAPIYTAKLAYVAAVNTMQTEHPNDWVTVVPYSQPRSSATAAGRLNSVRSPLGTNYNYATNALLFPFGTINADGSQNNTEINPYTADPATTQVPSSDFTDTPRADGETSFAMALMLAYNQFAVTSPTDGTLRSYATSSPINFPSGMAGGMGRKGAQKVVIFETDGLANTSATANLVNAGSYKYYKIRYNMNNPAGSEYPSVSATSINNSTVLNQIYSLVQSLTSAYGTSRNPFRLYAVGFGSVFQGANATSALTTLQTMQYYAGTQASPSTALPSNQIITGTGTQMSTSMINTFTQILDNGVQIALTK